MSKHTDKYPEFDGWLVGVSRPEETDLKTLGTRRVWQGRWRSVAARECFSRGVRWRAWGCRLQADLFRAYRGGVMGLCPIGPLGQRTLSGTGPFSPLVGQRLCAVGAATGALGRCALEKGARTLW